MNWPGFKKHLTGLLVALGAIVLSVGTGFSTFYFYEAATASTSAEDVVDDVRQNQTFGTDDDSISNTSIYYDVYFMPQMVDLTDYSDSTTDAWSSVSYTNITVSTSTGATKTVKNYSSLPADDKLFYKPVSLTDESITYFSTVTVDSVAVGNLNSTINYDPYVNYTDDAGTKTTGMWVPAYGYMDPDTRQYWDEEIITDTSLTDNTKRTGYATTSDSGSNGGSAQWEKHTGYVYPLTYRKFTNVKNITQEMLETVGVPRACLYDRVSDMYQLAFCSWSSSYISTSYTLYNKTYGNYPFEVSGSFPINFEIAYFGTSLDLYEEDSIYINGTPSIFFYPVYSTGKGYYELDSNNSSAANTRDAIRGNTINSSGDSEESLGSGYKHSTFLCYDSEYTTNLQSASTSTVSLSSVRCYRLSDVTFSTAHTGSATAAGATFLSTDPSYSGAWEGNWETIDYGGSPLVINQNAGSFNIYVIVLTSNSDSSLAFSTNQTNLILSVLASPTQQPYIQPFKSYDCDTISYGNGSRDYFIVMEKIYEPRLIAGQTKTFDYESDASEAMALIREAPTTVEKDSLYYDGATFDFDTTYETYDYTSPNTNYTYRFTDYFFSFQLAKNDKYDSYKVATVDDDQTTTQLGYNKPTATYRYSDGATATEDYKSDTLFISILEEYKVLYQYSTDSDSYKAYADYVDSFALDFQRLGIYVDGTFTPLASLKGIKTLGGVTVDSAYTDYLHYAVTTMQNLIRPLVSGIYNLYVHINFGSSCTPTSIDVWGHRRHNFFVNVNYVGDDGSPITTKVSGNNYIDITNYSYRYSSYYYLLSYIMPTDEYYVYGTTTTDSSGVTTGTTKTFLDILSTYHDAGYCLQDRVTGKYITYRDYKNYSDALAAYSSSSSAGETATALQPSDYNLFQITGNHVLEAVAEPTWASNTTSSSAEALL